MIMFIKFKPVRWTRIASFLSFFTALTVCAWALEPPFVSVDEQGQRQGAFIEVDGQRSFLHLDLDTGTQAWISIPSQNVLVPNTYSMIPASPGDRPWPKQGAIHEKGWSGIEFSALESRYDKLDKKLYLIFDLAGGETFKKIEADEPFAPFFLPYSGYFSPFLCALIKGVPFDKLLRKDVGVMMPLLDDAGNLRFQLLPAVSIGYDSLIVVSIEYSEAEYFPVKLVPEITGEALLAEAPGKIDGDLAEECVRAAKISSTSPSWAPEMAAVCVLWNDPRAAEVRKNMTAALMEEVDYWKLEIKNKDRIQYDMMIAAIIAGSEPSKFQLAGPQPYFTSEPDGALAAQVDRVLSQQQSEEEPLFGQDFYGMSIIAAMVNRWELSKELRQQATRRFKEEIGEMNETPLTVSQQYRALVWGKLLGSDKNPHRYRRMSRSYEENLARYQHCRRRTRELILKSHDLSNFADQKLHTYVGHIKSGLLNCGKRPIPPRKPKAEKPDKEERQKPEHEAVKETKARLKNFNNIRSLPKKIEKVFKVKAPETSSEAAEIVTEGASQGTDVPTGAGIPSHPFAVPEAALKYMLDEILETWGRALDALEKDPPRSDFQVFEEPQDPVLAPELSGYSQNLQDFLKACKKLALTLEAAAVTFDRVGGAKAQGDAEWESRQEIHLEALKYDSGVAAIDVADRLMNQINFLQSIDLEDSQLKPEVKEHLEQITEADYQELQEFFDSLRVLGVVLTEAY